MNMLTGRAIPEPFRYQEHGRKGLRCAGRVRRYRAGRAANPDQRLQPGKIVVPYRVNVGGKGTNYSKFIGSSFENDGETWGKWIKGIPPSNGGNILFLSGPRQ